MTLILNDSRGYKIELQEYPSRIVSLSPAITEILFELGLDERISGVTPFCVRPERAKLKKKVGSYGYVNFDLMKDIDPDIILAVTGYQDTLTDKLREKFNVFSFELPATLSGIIDLIVRVGIVTGNSDGAREIQEEMIGILGSIDKFNGDSVYIELDLGGPVTFGSLSYITDSLIFMGLDPIYKNTVKEWIEPDFDFVRQSDPDLIIYEPKMFSKRRDNIIDDLVKIRSWENLKAVKNKKIFVTPGNYDFFAHHGPSFIREVLPWLASKISK